MMPLDEAMLVWVYNGDVGVGVMAMALPMMVVGIMQLY
jgi:hypothetical protein